MAKFGYESPQGAVDDLDKLREGKSKMEASIVTAVKARCLLRMGHYDKAHELMTKEMPAQP